MPCAQRNSSILNLSTLNPVPLPSCRRLLSSSLSLSEVPQLASLYVPLDAGSHSAAGPLASRFHSAALLAAAIDTATLPLRCSGGEPECFWGGAVAIVMLRARSGPEQCHHQWVSQGLCEMLAVHRLGRCACRGCVVAPCVLCCAVSCHAYACWI